MKEYCEACRFFEIGATNPGVCRWRPIFVTRDRHDWCGQFQPTSNLARDIAREVVGEAQRLGGGG